MATNSLDAVLAQYEKAKQGSTSSTSKFTQEERMKKYFAAILSDKETQGQRRLRILPTTDGSSPFKEVWYHEIQVDGKFQKFYDPGKNDSERSPLTEVYEELRSTGNENDKKLASNYLARKFYIVKVIDRDNEEDGVKFWRFKSNYKNEGIYDKIIPIYRNKGDIADPEKGRDLILELTKAKTPKGAVYTVIQTVMYDDAAPIHEDTKLAESWVNDELTWEDVYSKKPVEYLEAIARGESPKWNTDKGGYDYGNSDSDEMSFGGSKPSAPIDSQAGDEPEDDMPF
jgi:hypothetical protein